VEHIIAEDRELSDLQKFVRLPIDKLHIFEQSEKIEPALKLIVEELQLSMI
jgi:hypothetical protein